MSFPMANLGRTVLVGWTAAPREGTFGSLDRPMVSNNAAGWQLKIRGQGHAREPDMEFQ